MKEELPKGWRKVFSGVYYNKSTKQLWIEGTPDAEHDCDLMGCSSTQHWIFKLQFPTYLNDTSNQKSGEGRKHEPKRLCNK